MAASAVARSAVACSEPAASSISARCAEVEVVDDPGLLLEAGQLGIVELVTARREHVELVGQGVRLAWRGDRAQLGLQPLALGGQLGTEQLRLFDGLGERALTSDQLGDVPGGAGKSARGLLGGGALGQVGAPKRELVDRRVEPLQLEKVVAQHEATR